jgi:hypothetical protein
MTKIVVPNTGAGFNSPTENLVGLQTVNGGGLTNANFTFDYGITEKITQEYQEGVFSNPISLSTLNIETIEEAKIAASKDLKVYPNYDLTEVTNFTLYGSLVKRLEVSLLQIINYFPAALEVDQVYYDYSTAFTCTNVFYNQNEETTTFNIDVARIKNIFDIDYSVNASTNIALRPTPVSPLRALTPNYKDYSLFIGTASTEFPLLFFTASTSLSAGTISLTVSGNCFSGETQITQSLVIRPNKQKTEMVFSNDFDEVEKFLLNRFVVPKYTSQFKVPRQTDDGTYYTAYEYLTWPLFGIWNLDITTDAYNSYVEKLASYGAEIDDFKTNLISRFLTTGAFHEFDTPDQKVEKVLQIYSRSFDETKKFIDALATITSVSYVAGNDIPSALLVYLAKTLGWDTNISPISNEDFLSSVYGVKNKSIYEGWTRDQTPSELNFDYYNKLILNSAYLYRSKGTRRSIEFLMKTVGAPEALVEYNESIYVADRTIKYSDFLNKYAQISGGTYVQNIPGYAQGTEYKFKGVTYTAFTTTQTATTSNFTLVDYPINEFGYPSMPAQTSDFFFQKGGGWYEQTDTHNSGQVAVVTNQTYTGQSPNSQLQTVPPSYGREYLDRFENFPNMDGLGFNLRQIKTRDKSEFTEANDFNSNSLVINVKNVDLFLNVSQGITYSVWENSVEQNYPIPYTGLSNPYPSPGNIDWTVINPEPQNQTFAEFAQTFYKNMINVRNRWYTTDGKSSGYPTLQLVFWNYLQSLENAGVDITQYSYQKMIDYTIGIGDYWTNLVQQTIPSTTIWNGGIKYENSAFHRQKYVYRRQRGCIFTAVPCVPCEVTGPIYMNDCIDETVSGSTFPWSGTSSTIESFSDALFKTVNAVVQSSGYTLSQCQKNSITSTWYIDLRLDDTILVQQPFFTGYGLEGPSSVPTNNDWLNGLENNLSSVYQFGLNYNVNSERIILSNSGCIELFRGKTLSLNVGINLLINCN